MMIDDRPRKTRIREQQRIETVRNTFSWQHGTRGLEYDLVIVVVQEKFAKM